MGFFTNMIQAFNHGGFVMWVIFAGQMVSIAIIAERVYALYIKRTLNNRETAKSLEEEIKKGQLEQVIKKTQLLSGSGSAIGKTILAGTQAARNHGGNEEIQSKMDEVLLAEGSVLEKRTGFLAAIGNIGTLAGLLGTIIGLIDSFQAVANSNPVEKAALLSNGISMAMHATAYGLIMAIPALIMFAVLQNRANALADDLNQSALMVSNWLSYNYEPMKDKTTRRASNLNN
ncbi:MAG: MotA/TolQ/ExbB proton channel family protein [Bdellovibrionaceae bacterium]|nr:MotA/TolQ/ExbB proton channel family protein [Bdellovibrio sp.]